MSLQLADHWIWDFWLVEDAGRHHAFYLKAPRTIGDPGRRHWNVSIGHAVSSDLTSWQILPDALDPSTKDSWDDCSTWTGSIIERDGAWHLLYTGTSRAEGGRVQRIGLATSTDLVDWERHGSNPVLETDPQWYETLDLDVWYDQAWRDPWVFLDPEDGVYHAFITARLNTGPAKERGVIGHARSLDLVGWEVLAPIVHPGGFGEMEVPQLVEHRDNWYLVFCSDRQTQATSRTATRIGSGTFYVKGATRFGPFDTDVRPLQADPAGVFYGGRLFGNGNGNLRYLAWERVTAGGEFVGRIGDPLPVIVDGEGHLSLSGDGRRGAEWNSVAGGET